MTDRGDGGKPLPPGGPPATDPAHPAMDEAMYRSASNAGWDDVPASPGGAAPAAEKPAAAPPSSAPP
ncbi:MAG TPA: hypothetical protein VHW23_28950, partial [Kofleriaceae bacterium]|nr:hypothetical protein [Kofleriaceae bacterium]